MDMLSFANIHALRCLFLHTFKLFIWITLFCGPETTKQSDPTKLFKSKNKKTSQYIFTVFANCPWFPIGLPWLCLILVALTPDVKYGRHSVRFVVISLCVNVNWGSYRQPLSGSLCLRITAGTLWCHTSQKHCTSTGAL